MKMKKKLLQVLNHDELLAEKAYKQLPLQNGNVLFVIEDKRGCNDLNMEFTPEEFEIVKKIFEDFED